VSTTAKAASLFAAGQAAATGVISTRIAALTEGVLKAMLLSKLKVAVVMLLAISALGIGASALPYRALAAENPSPASKSAKAWQDDGNLKETVLALEKRLWEAHTKPGTATYENLVADDFLGLDANHHSYTKTAVLDYFAKWRVTEYSIKDPKVVLLNATGAIVTYEVRLKIGTVEGKNVESQVRHNTSAWAKRDGNWWAVYSGTSLLEVDGVGWKAKMADQSRDGSSWEVMEPLSLQLEKVNAKRNP
jgi:hypothetical protein